jgi:hypothetical protein
MSRGLSPTLFIIGGETQMAEKNNATCSICGRDYHVCLSCRDSVQLAPWKIYTDTAEHYKIFQAIRGFSTGMYDKSETRDKLKNVDLSDLNELRPNIKEIIEDIMKEPVLKHIEEAIDIEVEKPVYSRKRSYKTDME